MFWKKKKNKADENWAMILNPLKSDVEKAELVEKFMEILPFSLDEASQLVERTPLALFDNLPLEIANDLKTFFEQSRVDVLISNDDMVKKKCYKAVWPKPPKFDFLSAVQKEKSAPEETPDVLPTLPESEELVASPTSVVEDAPTSEAQLPEPQESKTVEDMPARDEAVAEPSPSNDAGALIDDLYSELDSIKGVGAGYDVQEDVVDEGSEESVETPADESSVQKEESTPEVRDTESLEEHDAEVIAAGDENGESVSSEESVVEEVISAPESEQTESVSSDSEIDAIYEEIQKNLMKNEDVKVESVTDDTDVSSDAPSEKTEPLPEINLDQTISPELAPPVDTPVEPDSQITPIETEVPLTEPVTNVDGGAEPVDDETGKVHFGDEISDIYEQIDLLFDGSKKTENTEGEMTSPVPSPENELIPPVEEGADVVQDNPQDSASLPEVDSQSSIDLNAEISSILKATPGEEDTAEEIVEIGSVDEMEIVEEPETVEEAKPEAEPDAHDPVEKQNASRLIELEHAYEDKIRQLEHDLNAAKAVQQSTDDVYEEMKKMKDSGAALRNEKEHLEKEFAEFKKQTEEDKRAAIATNDEAKKAIDRLTLALETADKEVTALKEQHSNNQNLEDEKKQLEKTVADLLETQRAQEKEIGDALAAKQKELEAVKEKVDVQEKEYADRLVTKQQAIDALKEESAIQRNAQSDALSAKQKEIESLNEHLSEKDRELEHVKAHYEEFEKKRVEVAEKIRKLLNLNRELAQFKDEATSLREEMKKNKADFEVQLAEKEKDGAARAEQMNSLTRKCEELSRDKERLTVEVGHLQSQVKEFNKERQKADLIQKRAQLQALITEHEVKLKKASEDQERFKKDIEEKQTALADILKIRDELQNALTETKQSEKHILETLLKQEKSKPASRVRAEEPEDENTDV